MASGDCFEIGSECLGSFALHEMGADGSSSEGIECVGGVADVMRISILLLRGEYVYSDASRMLCHVGLALGFMQHESCKC